MSFHLTRTMKEYIITPIDESDSSIFITRETPTRVEERSRRYESLDDSNIICGIVGIITLVDSSFLIVITKERQICTILGSQIFQVVETKILPLSKKTPSINDSRYLEMVTSLLNEVNFFFYAKGGRYDLSLPFQTQQAEDFQTNPNPDFLWNWDMIPDEFQGKGTFNPFLHIIQGNVEFFQFPIISSDFWDREEDPQMGSDVSDTTHQGDLRFYLISRRYKRMSGTRYHRRGVNLDGDCSNFVETDQVILFKQQAFAYFIIRGSIPLLWTQKVNFKYNPPIDTSKSNSVESYAAFKKHFEYCQSQYRELGNEIFCVDLTKKKGSESRLKESFRKSCKKLKEDDEEDCGVLYYSFDVHAICGQTKFGKLKLLHDHVKERMEDHHQYFSTLQKTSQKGLFRVNCKDSLDRTNLVQTYLTQFHTEAVLRELKLLKDDESFENVGSWRSSKRLDRVKSKFYKNWKFSWSDNGDKVSRLYSGTGALRTDVSRYGKQSLFGLFNDGKKSVIRYFLNNLTDGYKQDCVDLVVRNYTKLSKTDRRSFSGLWKEKGLIMAIVTFIFFVFKPNVTPKKRRWFFGAFFIAMWLIVFVVVWVFTAFQWGKRIVNRPTILRNEYMRISVPDDDLDEREKKKKRRDQE